MQKEFDIRQHELEIISQSLADVFFQRRDLYPRQLDDGRYVSIQKSLKLWQVASHLRGDITLGTYILSAESLARFIVFDADDEAQFDRLKVMVQNFSEQGATGYLEQSRRGGHLWLFFANPVSGIKARSFGHGLIEAFDIQGIELFPKQNQLKDGPGSLVRLPFGIHRRTGQRYGFILPDGRPLAASMMEQIQILSHPQTIPYEFLVGLCGRQRSHPKQPQNTVLEPKEQPRMRLSDQVKASIAVKDFISRYVQLSDNDRGFCPFHDDQHTSFSVNVKENYWHCFAGCGGGSIIDFWMRWQKCDFTTAVRELAKMLLS
jgi:hypothetical protein